MKTTIAAVIFFGLLSGAAQAQNATTSSVAANSAIAIAAGASGGAGGAAGTLVNPGLLLGSTGGNNVTAYDACSSPRQVTIGPVSAGWAAEVDICWQLRMMDAMRKYPAGSAEYLLACTNKDWQRVDWDSSAMACPENRRKLPKTDPRSAAYVQPVAAVQPAPALPAGCRQVAGTTAVTC